jgi:hypothetical protein
MKAMYSMHFKSSCPHMIFILLVYMAMRMLYPYSAVKRAVILRMT